RHYTAREKTSAVFANVPAFVLGATIPHRRFEFARRFPSVPVLRSKNDFGIATDHFGFVVPQNPFRSSVPAHYESTDIHHKNGVVLDSLHQDPETFFALAEGGF